MQISKIYCRQTESSDGGSAVDIADDIAQATVSLRPSTPPAAPSRKRSALDNDIAEVDAPSARRVNADRAAVGSPSKRKRLEEEGLVLLESATDGMKDVDVIEIY